MNRLRNLIAVFAFSLLILGLPAIVSAQWRDNRNNNDYYGNANYNRNLKSTVKNLKKRSKDFAKKLDRELDRSRYDDRRREDRLNDLAKNFRDAADNLENVYDDRNDYNRSQNEARRVLSLGDQLDRALSRARLNGKIQGDWSQIQQDLRVLANSYDYNYNRRNNRNDDYRNNRNNRRGNIRNFPFPF